MTFTTNNQRNEESCCVRKKHLLQCGHQEKYYMYKILIILSNKPHFFNTSIPKVVYQISGLNTYMYFCLLILLYRYMILNT